MWCRHYNCVKENVLAFLLAALIVGKCCQSRNNVTKPVVPKNLPHKRLDLPPSNDNRTQIEPKMSSSLELARWVLWWITTNDYCCLLCIRVPSSQQYTLRHGRMLILKYWAGLSRLTYSLEVSEGKVKMVHLSNIYSQDSGGIEILITEMKARISYLRVFVLVLLSLLASPGRYCAGLIAQLSA